MIEQKASSVGLWIAAGLVLSVLTGCTPLQTPKSIVTSGLDASISNSIISTEGHTYSKAELGDCIGTILNQRSAVLVRAVYYTYGSVIIGGFPPYRVGEGHLRSTLKEANADGVAWVRLQYPPRHYPPGLPPPPDTRPLSYYEIERKEIDAPIGYQKAYLAIFQEQTESGGRMAVVGCSTLLNEWLTAVQAGNEWVASRSQDSTHPYHYSYDIFVFLNKS